MGTNFSVSNDLKLEVVTRAAIIMSGAKYIGLVISNPKLHIKKKLARIKAHVFHVFLQCSTRGPLSTLYGKTHHAVLSSPQERY